MPVVSAFFGIVIRMFYNDHEPPHFHAEHQNQRATFRFSGAVLAGEIRSATALAAIRDWCAGQRFALERNWRLARGGEPLERIPPLE